MCYVIPILSPFLFIQSLYASFLKSIGFFICLLSFLYTLSNIFSVDVSSMQVSKGEEVVIQKSAQGHFWS